MNTGEYPLFVEYCVVTMKVCIFGAFFHWNAPFFIIKTPAGVYTEKAKSL